MRPPSDHAALTNAPLLLSETAQVAQALLDGDTWTDLRVQAREGRLFGPVRPASQQTMLGALQARVRDVPADLLPDLASGTLDTRRILTLALATRHRPLLRAFLADVVLFKWQRLDTRVTDADARTFLTHQADQHASVAAWSAATTQKTRSSLTRFLVEAGVLNERGKGVYETAPQHLPAALRGAVQRLDPLLLSLLEGLK